MKAPLATRGRYAIQSLLGEGGMGRVFLANDRDLGHPVALKFLLFPSHSPALQYFHEEVRLLSRLSHPHLVKVLDYYDAADSLIDGGKDLQVPRGPFFAMEYISGKSFQDLPKALEAGRWVELLAQLCQGLHYLHSRNILHRDLKPSNVLFSEDGQAKIVDFGLAGILRSETPGSPQGGTLAYMPPEALAGRYDAQSDLFTLALIFYEGISGQMPFKKPFRSRDSQISPPTPLQNLMPKLPTFLCDLLHRMLELDPARRPASALSILRFLNQHLEKPIPLLKEEAAEAILKKVPLVGREAKVEEFWQAVKSGEGKSSPVLIQLQGPTGVGRSRFLEEMKWGLQLQSWKYLPIGPEGSPNWLPMDAGEDLLSQVKKFRASYQGTKTVLAFCDLHEWSVEALQNLKLFLNFTRSQGSDLVFILEWNSDLTARPLLDLFQAVQEFSPVEIQLQDLSEADSGQLLELAAQDAALSPEDAREIISGSGGRPLLLLQSLHHAFADGGKNSGTRTFPRDLHEVSRLRVNFLSVPAQTLLGLLVVHSRDLAFSKAAELWKKNAGALEDALLELDGKGFTAPRDRERPHIRLAQSSLKPVFLECLSKPQIKASHRSWMDGLMAAGSAEVIALAGHALDAEDLDLARKWAVQAGESLESQGKVLEAVDWYRRMLPFAQTAVERYTFHGRMAPLLYRLGRFVEALEAYENWFKDRPDDETLLQKVKHRFFTALVLFTWGRKEEAYARFEECIGTGDSERHAELRLYHARSLAFLAILDEENGKAEAALQRLRMALPIAADNSLLLGEIEQRWGEIERRQLDRTEALLHFMNSLRHYRAAQSPQAEAIAHQYIAMLQHESGEISQALSSIAKAVELSKSSGQILQWARYQDNQALVYMDAGDYGLAWEKMEEIKWVFEALGNAEDRHRMQLHRLDLYIRLGNLDQAEFLFQSLSEHSEALKTEGLWAAVLLKRGELAYQQFQYAQAQKYFTRVLELAREKNSKSAELSAKLAICRCLSRLAWLDRSNAMLVSTLEDLAGLTGPSFAVWKLALGLLSSESAEYDYEKLKELFSRLEALALPELRLDVYGLMAEDLYRRGMETSAQQLHQNCLSELSGIQQNLNEEFKMDFEKNRQVHPLDEAIRETLPRPKVAPMAPEPSVAVAPTIANPQISELRFRQYSEITRQISQKYDLEEILDRVMDASIEMTGAERGFLLLKNENSKTEPFIGYDVKTARRMSQQSLQEKDFQFSMSAVKQAIEQGKPMLTGDAQVDEQLKSKKSVMQYQLRSIMVLPLDVEGEVIGAIYLDDRYHPSRFNEVDGNFLTALASQAAVAIQKAWFVEDLKKAKQELESKVESQAFRIESLSGELDQVREQLRYGYEEMVGHSPAMMQVFQLLDHVTETVIPVWIHGESGTGKELVARSLHFNSPRKNAPFVSENCSAIPETLLESELFGHKKGAFTHADRDRVGLFEQADKGTLFLDEVADMSLNMQAKLLRVLQEGEIRPVGSAKKVKVDVRLVTASNKDLEQLVKEEKFRADLFFRMNGLTLRLPPLRERVEDIPLLVDYLLKKISRDYKLPPSELTDEAFQRLLDHPWSGNIRELEGVIRNALLFAKGRPIGPEILTLGKGWQKPGAFQPSGTSSAASPSSGPAESGAQEKQLVMEALRKHKMNKRLAAKEMGVSLRSFYMRMERNSIPKSKPVLARFLGLQK